MKRTLVVVGLVSSQLISADAVDDVVREEMERRHVPGVAVAVVREGKVVRLGAYGVANVEWGVKVTPGTVFQIQSITKTFVSAAVLMLAEEGKLGLDDAVSRRLEGVPGSWAGMTVRHLLTHTSGLKDYINDPVASPRREANEEEVFRVTTGRALSFAPGERYAYSNVNYLLLAMMVRKETGKSYGEFLGERVFGPLGMRSTRVMSHGEVIRERAAGYRWRDGALWNGEYVAESVLGHGWGGVVSTAEDMAKWAAAVERGKLLRREWWEAAWTGARLRDEKESGYGLGWAVEKLEGHREVGHGGGHSTGFTSHLAVYPEDGLAVVVLTNSLHARARVMARRVAGVYVAALSPKVEPVIEDRNPEVTARLRECFERGAAGEFAEPWFGPELWKVIAGGKAGLVRHLRGMGPVKRLELLTRKEAGEKRTFRYRAICEQGIFIVTVTREASGVISEWRMMEE